MTQPSEKQTRKKRGAIRSYMLHLSANPGKTEETRYALWWYRTLTLEYCQRYYRRCDLEWESTKGKGVLPNQAQNRARDIIAAGFAAYQATGTPFHCPTDFPLLCEGIVGHNKGTSFAYWVKTPRGSWLPAQTHRALKNALRHGGQLRKACEVRQGKNGGLIATVFVEFPRQKPIDTRNYLACDVGVNAGVARSDGYIGESLRPLLERNRQKRAEQQKQGHCKTSQRSAVKQILDREARCAVMLAKRGNKTLVLESSQALANLKPSGSIGGWPRQHYAVRCRQIAEVTGVSVREVWPARSSITCPQCWYSDKANRRGIEFRCVRCGHVAHADVVGSINLARRARGVWSPEIPDTKAALQIQSEGAHKTA